MKILNFSTFARGVFPLAIYLSLLATAQADVDIQWPKFPRELKELGLDPAYRPGALEKLFSYLEQEIKHMSEELLITQDLAQVKEVKLIEERLELFEILSTYLKNFPGPEEEAFQNGLRALYSIKSELELGRKMPPWELLKMLGQFNHQLNYESLERRYLPLESRSVLEAHNWGGLFLNQLSPMEVSELDVADNHPSAYTLNYLVGREDPFLDMVARQNRNVNELLAQKGKTPDYDLQESYRLLFFDKMSSKATSPKVYTKDSFSQKWKLKLGNEIQSESVVNRLAARIGQKVFDLSFTSAGKAPKIMMVLAASTPEQVARVKEYKRKKLFKNKELLNEICLNVSRKDELIMCFKDLTYRFDAKKFILGSGTFNDQNILMAKNYLPSNADWDSLKSKLLGREFVIFRESNVEFGGGQFKRLGAVSTNNLGAPDDRYWRGSGLFHYLIWDADAKEGNARGVFTEDGEYLENPHDLASSLGSPLQVGNFNKLKIGEDFVTVNKNEDKIKFKGFVGFRPKAWERASFADFRWMAKRLALLTPSVLKEVFKSTHLPEFVQDVGVYRLGLRIKRILELYQVDHQAFKNLVPPKIDLEFNLENAQKLGVDPREFAAYLQKHEIPGEHMERVVEDGYIASCKESHMVNLLEQTAHPSGLSRRLVRFFDGRPLKDCWP